MIFSTLIYTIFFLYKKSILFVGFSYLNLFQMKSLVVKTHTFRLKQVNTIQRRVFNFFLFVYLFCLEY